MSSRQTKSNIFVISAPSGAGKTSLCGQLVASTSKLLYSVSYTSRPPRDGEENGKSYFFISRHEFKDMIRANRFVEWAEVYGNYYGTAKETVRKTLATGNDVLFDVDVEGARQLKEAYPDSALIFIIPPSIAELVKRLRGRGQDSREVMMARAQRVKSELRDVDLYDFVVVNDRFDDALSRLRAIILAERSKRYRFKDKIQDLLREPMPAF